MLRVGVCLTLVTLAVACSSTTDPGATPRAFARQVVAGKPIPILPNAHVVALPVFDNGKVTPRVRRARVDRRDSLGDLDLLIGQ